MWAMYIFCLRHAVILIFFNSKFIQSFFPWTPCTELHNQQFPEVMKCFMEPCLALLLSLLPAHSPCDSTILQTRHAALSKREPQIPSQDLCLLYKSQHKKDLSFQGILSFTWTLCLFNGLWLRVLSYLNSSSESVLLELFLLHGPGTLMLLQTWSYRWCLQGSGKWMNPRVQKAVTAVSGRAWGEVCPGSTAASTGYISKQGAEQAEPVSLGGLEGKRQIEARSHTTTSCTFVQGIIQRQKCALHSLEVQFFERTKQGAFSLNAGAEIEKRMVQQCGP